MTIKRHWTPARLRTPAMLTVAAFALAIAAGTALLMLPAARQGSGRADFTSAIFTSTSAVCVTGLAINDTPHYWTTFGQTVIMVLIQIGGFGIMTMASLVGIMLSRRFGIRRRLRASTEVYSNSLGDVRRVVIGVGTITAVVEGTAFIVLTLRFWLTYHYSLQHASWLGLFHAVSAFNNAGFALWSNNLMNFVGDPVINNAICFSIIAGGLGFPVIMELWRRRLRNPASWSLHTQITVAMTIFILIASTVFISAMEWRDPNTLGKLSTHDSLLAGWFQAVNTRTAGFNTIDIGQMHPATWLGMDFMMFIGAGTGGTAGGVKLTTFAVLLLVILAEARNEEDVTAFRRRIPSTTVREAITVALLAIAAVAGTTLLLLAVSPYPLGPILFEDISALGTVGLSTGITASLPTPAHFVLIGLMFLGRLGPLGLATAIVARERTRRFHYPTATVGIG